MNAAVPMRWHWRLGAWWIRFNLRLEGKTAEEIASAMAFFRAAHDANILLWKAARRKR
jgi:hypothetical protein